MISQSAFDSLCAGLFALLGAGEQLVVELTAEDSQFIRINRARVRQIGTVSDASCSLTFFVKGDGGTRQASATCSLGGDPAHDLLRASELLFRLRGEVPTLPLDPFAVLPENRGSSAQVFTGKIPSPSDAVAELLPSMAGLELTGVYAAGAMARANANSAGQRHWFATEAFSLDYSLRMSDERSGQGSGVKETYAGNDWEAHAYVASLAQARELLSHLQKPAVKIARGAYRVYLAPAAVDDLVRMLSWDGVGEAAIRQGDSPLRRVREGASAFSKLFTLSEDFSFGGVPRFNSLGELAPESLALVRAGNLENTLISSRTASEYGLTANGAELSETLRAPRVGTGTLRSDDIFATLGTGLYLSNLHYLNWSDQAAGRITGMTRYACFWVERGTIVGPIENLRFDDSLFSLLGAELEALTDFQAVIPEVSSYLFRELGGSRMPGALIRKMEFTL